MSVLLAPSTITAALCAPAELSEGQREDAFALLGRHFDGVTREQFERDLSQKNAALLLRDAGGALVGFSTLLVYESRFDGRPVSVVCSGDTIVDPSAWSSSALPREWIAAVKRLQEDLGSRLRFVYRHFPRSGIHPFASVAAEATEAAAAQGRFWEMHDLLYAREEPLGDVDYERLAVKLGIDLYRFRSELAAGRWARRVKEQYQSGEASGVVRTPTFFLNGRKLDARDYDGLAAAVAAMR